MTFRPMLRIASVRNLSVAVVVLTGACGANDPVVEQASAELDCVGPDCYVNSPIIAGTPFYELHRDGQPNDQGFRIAGFRSARGEPFQIDVQHARLVGLDPLGNIALDTPAMTGAVIAVVDKQGAPWEIEVVEIGSAPFWALPEGETTTYELRVRAPDGEEHNLCPRPPATASWPGGAVTHAMVFEGDRYRSLEKTVWSIGAATAGWFNIACAGHATAKMHLTRHTEAGANPALPTTQQERQAMLRAFTAAVCWGSDSFTGNGESLYVADRKGVMPGPINLASVEALWGPMGAVCIGEQRLVHANSMPQPEADLILAKLQDQCPNVPPCSSMPELSTKWREYGMVLSTNP